MTDVLTITFNPTIDKSTSVESLIPEKKLKCEQPVFEPGGGGINVARVIKRLGGDVTALFPAGGYSGKFLQELIKKEGVEILITDIQKHTRENLIVVERKTNQQFRFGMPGPELMETEWQDCLRKIESSNAKWIVASGSLPAGVPMDIYARIAAISKKIGAQFFVDTSGEALKHAVMAGVDFIKPNLGELASLVGAETVQLDEVDDVARQLITSHQCKNIIISLGEKGALLVTAKEEVMVHAPVVRKRSTVGAGDSMVAGVISALSRGWSIADAVRYGVACGTATTMQAGTKLCDPADVERLYASISKKKSPAK